MWWHVLVFRGVHTIARGRSQGMPLVLFLCLPCNDTDKHPEKVFLPTVHSSPQWCVFEQLDEQGLSLAIGNRYQSFTLAFLPAVAVGGWAGSFEAAVVASMAGVGTFRAAAEGPRQTTRATLKDVLDRQQI